MVASMDGRMVVMVVDRVQGTRLESNATPGEFSGGDAPVLSFRSDGIPDFFRRWGSSSSSGTFWCTSPPPTRVPSGTV